MCCASSGRNLSCRVSSSRLQMTLTGRPSTTFASDTAPTMKSASALRPNPPPSSVVFTLTLSGVVPITSAAKPFGRALRRRPDFDGIAGDECRGVHRLHGRMGDMIAHIVGLDSRFTVSGHYAHAVLRTLPPIVHITKESEQAALRWAVERMMLELREPQPGGFLVAQHLAHMMLLQSLRLHLADGMGTQVGWFPALADRQICAAITAMHAEPAYRWNLQELAERAAMPRLAFALNSRQPWERRRWTI
ncbi:hypothetical protein CN141_21350 [Sinorhizobium meliloti]|nr:hypothetical protein CN141_21350 [Sinorhizobium meliloti]